MICTRHLPALSVLLALACVPTVVHSYLDPPAGDGRSAADVPIRLNGLQGLRSSRSTQWVTDTYGTSDFIERQYGPDLTLFVARSYDAKRLYHHPENGVAHGDGYTRPLVIRTEGRPDVPIFMLKGSRRLSVYALLYGGEFVDSPIKFQLRNALTLLVRPRALMTLFFVRERTGGESRSADVDRAEALLLAAIDGFRTRSVPPPQ